MNDLKQFLRLLFVSTVTAGLSGCPVGDDNNDRDLIPKTTHEIQTDTRPNYHAI